MSLPRLKTLIIGIVIALVAALLAGCVGQDSPTTVVPEPTQVVEDQTPTAAHTPTPFAGGGRLSGTITGLEGDDRVLIRVETYILNAEFGQGETIASLEVGNGPWEIDGLNLRSGHYAIDPGRDEYWTLVEGARFDVPEPGVHWRHEGMDFDFFRPEHAVEKFGIPVCGYDGPAPTPTPWYNPIPWGGCMSRGMMIDFTGAIHGEIKGLPAGIDATVVIQRLPPVEGELYDVPPGGWIDGMPPIPPRLSPLDSVAGQEPVETIAKLPVSPGRWGMIGVPRGIRYLVTLQVEGMSVSPPGYIAVPYGGRGSFPVKGADFTVQ